MSDLSTLADMLAEAATSEPLIVALGATEPSPRSMSIRRSHTFAPETFAWVDVTLFARGETGIVEVEFAEGAQPDVARLEAELGPTVGRVDGDELMRFGTWSRPDLPSRVQVSFVVPPIIGGRVSRMTFVR